MLLKPELKLTQRDVFGARIGVPTMKLNKSYMNSRCNARNRKGFLFFEEIYQTRRCVAKLGDGTKLKKNCDSFALICVDANPTCAET